MDRAMRTLVRAIGVIFLVIAFYITGIDFNLSLLMGAMSFLIIMVS